MGRCTFGVGPGHYVAFLTCDLELVGWIPSYGKTFFLAIFYPSPQMHVGKAVSSVGKKSCVSTGLRNPGTHRCTIDCHDMTLAVKMV